MSDTKERKEVIRMKTSFRRKDKPEIKTVVEVTPPEGVSLLEWAQSEFTVEEVEKFLEYGLAVKYFQPLRQHTDEEVAAKMKARFGDVVKITPNVRVETQDEVLALFKRMTPEMKEQVKALIKAKAKVGAEAKAEAEAEDKDEIVEEEKEELA